MRQLSETVFDAFRTLSVGIRVRAATTANITIATALNPGDTLDGVTLAEGDLVLVKDQSTASQNGIYIVAAIPVRHIDYSSRARDAAAAYNRHPGALFVVMEGTTNADTVWLCTSNRGAGDLDSTSLAFTLMLPAVGAQPLDAYLTTLAGLDHTLLGVQIKTASGTYTPTTGTSVALVFLQAAGGGGGGVGSTAGTGRGGAGGAGETRAAAVVITGNVTVTLGAAGGGASAGNNAGGTASDSTFGSSITSKGGTGGGGSTGATNGTSGTTPAGSGGVAIPPTATAVTTAGWFQGGSTLFGLGAPNLLAGGGGPSASGYGAGGAGGYDTGSSTRVGGGGGEALCLILEFA